MGKIKKHTLNIEYEVEFDVFGLSTPFADYRLAWALNEQLDFKFEKSKLHWGMDLLRKKAEKQIKDLFS